MVSLLLSLLLTASLGSANSLQCVDLFAKSEKQLAAEQLPPQAEALLRANKPQEASWWLADRGFYSLAQKIDRQILNELATHAPKMIRTQDWQQLSRSDNAIADASVLSDKLTSLAQKTAEFMLNPKSASIPPLPMTRNNTYRVNVGRLQAVIKFGKNAAITEVLAYQIAQVLGVKVPATIAITVEGKPASLQYYVADRPTAMRASLLAEVGDLNHSWKTSFFDFIFRNSDRHDENYLIDIPIAQIKGKNEDQLNKAEQILIDNELMFDSLQSAIDMRPSTFMRKYVPFLYLENPKFAEHLANPDTQQRLLDLIANSEIKHKKEVFSWIEDTLGIYQRVYSAHFE